MSLRSSSDGLRAGRMAALVGWYAAATLVGGLVFVALLRLNAAIGPGVLFYRGLVALALAAIVLFIAAAFALPRLPARLGLRTDDAFGGTIVASSLLCAFFVLGPVTVDRSISVFMLSQLEQAGRPLTDDEARDRFVRVYVDHWSQIARRLVEQELSGNLERTAGGWRLTAQGERLMRVARAISALSGGDPRFVGRTD